MSDCQPVSSGPLSSCSVRIGLVLIAQSACLSFIAVVSLLAYVSYHATRNRHAPEWRFIRSHLDLYLLGLLSSDLIQSIDIKWIAMSGVHEGGFCTAQGIFFQFGDVGVALFSLAIAVHTFAELVLRWKVPRTFIIPSFVISLYVVFLTLIVGIGYAVHGKDYYGDTTYWCWIKKPFLKDGIALEYAWLWVAALANLAFYLPVFLALKRLIIVEPSKTWLRYRVRRMTRDERLLPPKYEDTLNARQMLFYPAVYILTVLPIAATRIPFLAHNQNIPFPATVVSGVLFSASGTFNVIVYTITRPALLRSSAVRPATAPQLFWSETDQMERNPPSL